MTNTTSNILTENKSFSEISVGDRITVFKKGKRYTDVEVKGADRRRWVSARKVGMRWQPKGVGITQLQIEGFTLHDVKKPRIASGSSVDVYAIESVVPDPEDIGLFAKLFSWRFGRRESNASALASSNGTTASSSSDGGFWSSLGSLFD